MVCSSRLLAVSYPTSPLLQTNSLRSNARFVQRKLRSNHRWRRSMASEGESSSFAPPVESETADINAAGFCIIEGPETVQDFAKMELREIQDNIRSRRNKIFLHMEEVRRLRIQQRLKNVELGIQKDEQENELPDFPSFIPFLPPLSSANLKLYYATCFSLIAGIIIFGGLLAPTHLGITLFNCSDVDPIVASFSGGAVGVISALMVVEINNVKQQERKRCKYCLGTGYLACARCSSTGALVLIEPVSTVNGGDQPLAPPKTERCSNCSGSGKVMCPTCLCTGMAMASEHDPRIDPFD
ncbi:hypothetical protein RHMOL_Rhmol03G0184000 [Rhododendron molle]|uniref:Uncharacterized protein n=1 Tax=Rhododendron molle TaxID=49168 RepID=A0ACC0PFJ7_RHOML|nr:hypothetical protein RHMOL_Rhmol03G0184000 [Rhododendron molle]